jgi:hypothetical protein
LKNHDNTDFTDFTDLRKEEKKNGVAECTTAHFLLLEHILAGKVGEPGNMSE